jgi:hypothetical protein
MRSTVVDVFVFPCELEMEETLRDGGQYETGGRISFRTMPP